MAPRIDLRRRDHQDIENSELGDKPHALIRLAALIASQSAAPSYQWAVRFRAAGVSDDEVAGVLMTVAPIVGIRVSLPLRRHSRQHSATSSILRIRGSRHDEGRR